MLLDRKNLDSSIILNEFNFMLNKVNTRSEIVLNINDLPKNTALIIVDMVNSFATEGGELYSNNVKDLIPSIVELAKKFEERNMPIIAYRDSHNINSPEFHSFPSHSLQGTYGSELVDELKEINSIISVLKNSTNGCIAKNPYEILEGKYTSFVIVGCCSDICIYQLALTLKTYFNQLDIESSIIIPTKLVTTFNAVNHNADIYDTIFFYSMIVNGIDIVGDIK